MDKVKRIQELRRSNAATAIPSKKKYSRKTKYKNKFDNQLKKLRTADQSMSTRHAVKKCDFNLLNTVGQDLIMSVQTAILATINNKKGKL